MHDFCIDSVTVPMQSTCPGSGSHSLFPVHTDAFGPVSINPGGHVYVMNCPSTNGWLS